MPPERVRRIAFDRHAPAALVVALITLAASGVGFRSAVQQLNVHLTKLPVDLRRHLTSLPRRLGPWRSTSEDALLDAASTESLGTTMYLNRAYDLEGEPARGRLLLHVAYYTGMVDAVPHILERCAVAAGWNALAAPATRDLPLELPEGETDPGPPNRRDGEPYRLLNVTDPLTGTVDQIRMPFGRTELRTFVFGRDDQPQVRHQGGFFFIANHHLTASPTMVRSLAFRPSERYAYYMKVQLEMTGPAGEGPERFLELSASLVQHLLPHLMRCLPDWSEVEGGRVHSER
jgi:hypothetical protein